RTRLERDDGDAARGLGARPHGDAVDRLQAGDERIGQLAGPRLDCRAADPGLKRERLPEGDHRRLVALAERLERLPDAGPARVRAVDARPDLRVHALVDVEDAVLLRAARPLVRAAAVEVGLDAGEVDVHQAEALRAVDERHDAALASEPAELGG